MSARVRTNIIVTAILGLLLTISSFTAHRVQEATVSSFWDVSRKYPATLWLACLLPWGVVPIVFMVHRTSDRSKTPTTLPQTADVISSAAYSAMFGICLGLTMGNLLSALTLQRPWMWYGFAVNLSWVAAFLVAWRIGMLAWWPVISRRNQQAE